MIWQVELSDQADLDLGHILQFLHESYRAFGDAPEEPSGGADRIRRMAGAMAALGSAPHQGTLRPELGPGIHTP